MSEEAPIAGWIVIFTDYLDDYKRRGADWSTSSAPIYCVSKEEAKKHVTRELVRRISEELQEYTADNLPRLRGHPALRRYEESDSEGNTNTYLALRAVARRSFKATTSVAKKLFKGEYTDTTFSWRITPVKMEPLLTEADFVEAEREYVAYDSYPDAPPSQRETKDSEVAEESGDK